MSDARNSILGRLRAADTSGPLPAEDFQVVDQRGWSLEERLTRLRANMEGVHAEFLDARQGGWVAAVKDWLRVESVPALVYAPETDLGRVLAAEWGEGGAALVAYDRAMAEWKDEFFAHAGAGLTSTEGGIAATGSLIVRPSAQEPRTLSLVPPIHIAVLDTAKLYDTMWVAMREQNWPVGMPTNLLLISGPSKTADIEQTLAYGVHGPKRLLVVLI